MAHRRLSPKSIPDASTLSSDHSAPAIGKRSIGRSCITCYKRKTKCDKKLPCSGCQKQKFECSYPPTASRTRKKRIDSYIFKSRLEKLEGLVEDLNKHVDEETRRPPTSASENVTDKTEDLSRNIGSLVIEEGWSRYLENSFWQILSDKVSNIQRLLTDDYSDDDGESLSPEHIPSSVGPHQGYFFGFNSIASDLIVFHPSQDHILLLWKIFKNNVDPLVKVLHKPLAEARIVEWTEYATGGIDKSFEALLFAVYFASITSMSSEDCQSTFGQDKDVLLNRYRFAVQQGLARANFLNSRTIMTLQAFLIYLTCERSSDDNNLVWNLTGVAVRVAQSLGIHRDGSAFNLPPLETEVRRRLWWHLYLLDVRTSENHGSDIEKQKSDTKLPLNLDDTMLGPKSTEAPEARIGFTDMTLPLIRYETITYFVRLRSQTYAAANGQSVETTSFLQVDEAMDECRNKIEERYLKFCDPSKPFHWFVAIVARMMIVRVWANVYHPLQLGNNGGALPEGARDRTFVVSLEILESWLVLVTDQKIRHWKFAFQSYSPWQALAFVLLELCTRARSEMTIRAWTTAAKSFEEWAKTVADKKHDLVWNRMRRLLDMAQRSRAAIPPESEVMSNGPSECSNFAPIEASLGTRPSPRDSQIPTCPSIHSLPQEDHLTTQIPGLDQSAFNGLDIGAAFDSNPLPFLRWAAELDSGGEQPDDIGQDLALFDEGSNWW